MNILRYNCVKSEGSTREYENIYLVRGANGEVYEISPLTESSPCKQDQTYTIRRCIHVADGVYPPRSVTEIKKFLHDNYKGMYIT